MAPVVDVETEVGCLDPQAAVPLIELVWVEIFEFARSCLDVALLSFEDDPLRVVCLPRSNSVESVVIGRFAEVRVEAVDHIGSEESCQSFCRERVVLGTVDRDIDLDREIVGPRRPSNFDKCTWVGHRVVARHAVVANGHRGPSVGFRFHRSFPHGLIGRRLGLRRCDWRSQ